MRADVTVIADEREDEVLPDLVRVVHFAADENAATATVGRVLPNWLNPLFKQKERAFLRQRRGPNKMLVKLPEVLNGIELADLLQAGDPLLLRTPSMKPEDKFRVKLSDT